MPFDLSTAQPIDSGFDLSTAQPVDNSIPAHSQQYDSDVDQLGADGKLVHEGMPQQDTRQPRPIDNIPLLRNFAGAGETALSLASSILAFPMGIVKTIAQRAFETSQDSKNRVQQLADLKKRNDLPYNAERFQNENNLADNINSLTYQPRTITGQDYLNKASNAIHDSGVIGLAPLAEMSALSRLGDTPNISKNQSALDLQKSQNLTTDTTKAEVNAAGYKVPPSLANGSTALNAVEGLSGKEKAKQLFIVKNQPNTNSLAKADLGLPNSVSLNETVLAQDRYDKSQPYRDAAALPQAVVGQKTERSQGTGGMVVTDIVKSGQQLVDDLNETRAASKRYWKAQGSGLHPEAYDKAVALDKHANDLETQIEALAKANNQPDLVNQLKDARIKLAKNYLYDNALNDSNGNIDAVSIGKAAQNSKLTGNAATIAKFANGFRDVARMPKMGDANPTTAVDYGIAGMMLAGHAATAGIPLTAAAIPMLTRLGGRYGLLSSAIQDSLTHPNYQANTPILPSVLNKAKNQIPYLPQTAGAFTGNPQ